MFRWNPSEYGKRLRLVSVCLLCVISWPLIFFEAVAYLFGAWKMMWVVGLGFGAIYALWFAFFALLLLPMPTAAPLSAFDPANGWLGTPYVIAISGVRRFIALLTKERKDVS